MTQTREMLRFMLEARTVFAAIVGISWFWFYGALFLSQFPASPRIISAATSAR